MYAEPRSKPRERCQCSRESVYMVTAMGAVSACSRASLIPKRAWKGSELRPPDPSNSGGLRPPEVYEVASPPQAPPQK